MRIVTIFILLLSFNTQATETEYVIGVSETAPFAMKDSAGNWTGISIELWENIAKDSGIKYRYLDLPLKSNLTQLEKGDVDISLGAISITQQRETVLDFSHSYYSSGLGIITKQNETFSVIDLITSSRFLKSVGLLVGVIILGGVLILIFENGPKEDDFKKTDINNGIWWSIVTITTTGYGDLVPKSKLGRTFGGVWMIIGAIIAPMLIGSMSANLAIEQQQSTIQDRDDLINHEIGILANTSTETYFKEHNLPYVPAHSVQHMIDLIQNDTIDGGVYDAPILQYFARQHPELIVLPDIFDRQNYGIVLQNGSELRESINLQLLIKTNNPKWLNLLNKYLGE